ncbi:MAG: hypothetical protein ACF8K1_07360 [Phycisphaerales bacterium JB047]
MREHETTNPHRTQRQSGATRNLSLLLCLGALAGVLIWAKLRLVTDIPRSAYAAPKERSVESGSDAVDGHGDRGVGEDASWQRDEHP